jgi:hypothetical protein
MECRVGRVGLQVSLRLSTLVNVETGKVESAKGLCR